MKNSIPTVSVAKTTTKIEDVFIPVPSYWRRGTSVYLVESNERVTEVCNNSGFHSVSVKELWLVATALGQAEQIKEHEYQHELYNALGVIGGTPLVEKEKEEDADDLHDVLPFTDPNDEIDRIMEERSHLETSLHENY